MALNVVFIPGRASLPAWLARWIHTLRDKIKNMCAIVIAVTSPALLILLELLVVLVVRTLLWDNDDYYNFNYCHRHCYYYCYCYSYMYCYYCHNHQLRPPVTSIHLPLATWR